MRSWYARMISEVAGEKRRSTRGGCHGSGAGTTPLRTVAGHTVRHALHIPRAGREAPRDALVDVDGADLCVTVRADDARRISHRI